MLQKLTGLVRSCITDYAMISPGDRIAVGLSGGKDSAALLRLLCALREYTDVPFTLSAITVDLGFGMDYTPVADWCASLGVPYTHVRTEIGPIIFERRKEKNPCSMCSRMRRGSLNEAALQQGISKIALGHHFDDAVETFFMELLFEGRLNCFQPVTYLDRRGVTQIRPLLYLHEAQLERLAEEEQLPVVKNRCPADKFTKRQEIKELLGRLEETYPEVRERIFGAMQRLPLPHWERQLR